MQQAQVPDTMTPNAASATPTFTAQQEAYVASIATADAERYERERAAAQQTFAAQPTSTPIPLPYVLALEAVACTNDGYGFNKCEGSVKNLTGAPVSDIEAVIEWFTAQDPASPIVSSDEALIDFNPVLPGQTSPFSTIGRYNPELRWFRVVFKQLGGGTVLTRDDRTGH